MLRQLIAAALAFSTVSFLNINVDIFEISKKENITDQKLTTGMLLQTKEGNIWLEHGKADGTPIKVPKDYKLISCYCKQDECVRYTPHNVQAISLIGNKLLLFTVVEDIPEFN